MSVHSGPGNLEDFYLTKHPLVKVMSSWFARENGRELSKALPKSRGLGTPRTTGANLKVASELTGGKPACQVVCTVPHGTEAFTCDCQAGKLQVMFSLQPSEGSHIQAYTTDSGCSYEMPKSNCTENITDQALCLQHIDKKLSV